MALSVAAMVRALHGYAGMWILLGIILVAGWLALKLIWNVAAFGVHLLLAAAVIALIVHIVVRARGRGRGSPAGP
jgi:hypothetical protein